MKINFNFFKNLNISYVALFIFYFLFLGMIISAQVPMQSAPGCLYGCSPMFSNANLKSVLNDPYSLSSNIGLSYEENNLNGYPKLQYFVLAGLNKYIGEPMFGFDYVTSWKSYFIFNIIMFTLMYFLVFMVGRKLFENKELAVLAAMYLVNPLTYLTGNTYKYYYIPLLFILFYYIVKYINSDSKLFDKWFYILTFLIVLNNNTYSLMPFYFNIFLGVLFLMYFFNKVGFKNLSIKNIISFFKDLKTRKILFITIIPSVLTLLTPWWTTALILGNEAQSKMLNDSVDFSIMSIYFEYIFVFLKNYFFNFSNSYNSISTILMYVGIFFLFFSNMFNEIKYFSELSKATFFAYFVAAYQYLILVPFLGIDLTANKLCTYFLGVSKFLFVFGGLYSIMMVLKSKLKLKNFKIYLNFVFLMLFILLSLFYINNFENYKSSNAYIQTLTKSPNYLVYEDLYYNFYEVNNINPKNTIILSTNELSNTLTGMVGPSIISGRYAHFYQFVDYQPYWFDAAVMLYSNNSENRLETLKKYSTKIDGEFYLYWDFYWYNSEYTFDKFGRMSYYYNPYKFYDRKYDKLLSENGIEYFSEKQSFEPNTYNRPQFRKFDLSILSPSNYHNQSNPWNPDLNNYLEEVWSYDYNGQKIARLFKINLD